MNAAERRCANPKCRTDISDLRSDAVVCRRKACRDWRDRASCFKVNRDTGTIRGHSHLSGNCTRCGTYCRKSGTPRDGHLPPRVASRVSDDDQLHGSYQLRTRVPGDPLPAHAPPAEDFDLGDGWELYVDAERDYMANLSLAERDDYREWLNRVAPDPDYTKAPEFERESNWKPARHTRADTWYRSEAWGGPDEPSEFDGDVADVLALEAFYEHDGSALEEAA